MSPVRDAARRRKMKKENRFAKKSVVRAALFLRINIFCIIMECIYLYYIDNIKYIV